MTTTDTTTRKATPRKISLDQLTNVRVEDMQPGYVIAAGIVLEVTIEKRPGRAKNLYYLHTLDNQTSFAEQGTIVQVICDLGTQVAANLKASQDDE